MTSAMTAFVLISLEISLLLLSLVGSAWLLYILS